MLEEHLLDTKRHQLEAFSCGVPALDQYLRRFAGQHQRAGISTTYVLVDDQLPTHIMGYYTLSAAEIAHQRLSIREQQQLPRYPIPCFRMGRLACQQDHQGKGLGRLLLGLAVDRCLMAREHIAAWALIVDAKDQQARAFYQHYGFTAFSDNPLMLYLPLGTMDR